MRKNPPKSVSDSELAEANIRRLELELQSERSKLWDAQRTIAYLDAELANQRRIRNLAKSLVRAIDQAIKNNIENLNKPKRKRASNGIALGIERAELSKIDRDKLSKLVKYNDFQNFYSKESSGSFKKAYAHKITKAIYTGIRWPVTKLGRFIVRCLKKVRSLI